MSRLRIGRVVAASVAILALVAVAAFAVLAVDVLLLLFAAILVAVLLRGLAQRVARWTRLPVGPALALVGTAFVAIVAGGAWALSQSLGPQFTELARSLPGAAEALRARLTSIEAFARLAELAPSPAALAPRGDVLARITGFFSSTLGAFANALLALVVGAYLAADAHLYTDGFARLFPRERRERVRAVLDELAGTLRWWLASVFLSMSVVGALTYAGLALLDFPLAGPLAVIAALLTFIPNLGPLLALIPAVLLALLDSPIRALHVVALYTGIQLVESYLITPLLQKRIVSLPPALTITAQLAAGVVLGLLGLLLAAPLTAVALVLVRRLYLDFVLGERIAPLGPDDR